MSNDSSTILLVEDDPNDVLLIKRAFTKANISNPIQIVSDGEEAMDYLAGEGSYSDRRALSLACTDSTGS